MALKTSGLAVVVCLCAVCAGCTSLGVEQRVEALERQQAALDSRVKKLERFDADVEAVRAYFKQVSGKVRSMRDDIVALLDEQSLLVQEGRAQYIRVLRRQKQLLADMQAEIDRAVKELEKDLPEAEQEVRR